MQTECFDREYWQKQYGNPGQMDGHRNAGDHVRYIQSFFDLQGIQIRWLAEFGYGYGKLLQTICEIMQPWIAVGVEPSEYAFNQAAPFFSGIDKLSTFNEDMVTWLTKEVDPGQTRNMMDLAICMGVFQYLPDDYLRRSVMLLAHHFKWLYLTAATDVDYKVMAANGYTDDYAIKRSREWYQDKIGEWFTCVGMGLWESRVIFSHATSPLRYGLYRY